jgi:hypothetical protein
MPRPEARRQPKKARNALVKPMGGYFHCDLCRLNRRTPAALPGICKYCVAILDRRREAAKSTVEERIRAKDQAGLTLTPVEYAIARVRMQPPPTEL